MEYEKLIRNAVYMSSTINEIGKYFHKKVGEIVLNA